MVYKNKKYRPKANMLCKRYTYKMKNKGSAIKIENIIVKEIYM